MDRHEGCGRDIALGQGLEDQGRIQSSQPRAADILTHIDARKAEGRSLAHDIDGEVAVLVPLGREGGQFPCRKVGGKVLDGALIFAQGKVHAGLTSWLE